MKVMLIFRSLLLSMLSIFLFTFSNTTLAETKLVMLGTGTPVPDSKRTSASYAVIYNNKAYVFDAGNGMTQRAIQAAQDKNIKALYPTSIQYIFFTHLHSDHTIGYPVLAATYWWRRNVQLEAYGPMGLNLMTESYYQMMEEDVDLRLASGSPIKHPDFYKVKVHEYDKGGWVFKDGNVTVEAFDVNHGSIHPAFGYKVTTPDKTIVFSGDTVYNENVLKMATGADILVHEVISEEGLNQLSPFWQKYHRSSHTISSDLAKLANKAKPKLLILAHVLHYRAPIESALYEVKKTYSGHVILANDLDIIE